MIRRKHHGARPFLLLGSERFLCGSCGLPIHPKHAVFDWYESRNSTYYDCKTASIWFIHANSCKLRELLIYVMLELHNDNVSDHDIKQGWKVVFNEIGNNDSFLAYICSSCQPIVDHDETVGG